MVSPPDPSGTSSSRTRVMTVVSMGSRHRSLGIGHLLDVLVDDGIEVRIVDEPWDSVQVITFGLGGDDTTAGQLQDGFLGGACREFTGDGFVPKDEHTGGESE